MQDTIEYSPQILRDLRRESVVISSKINNVFSAGESHYSFAQILEEVDSRSEVGIEFYKIYVWIRNSSFPENVRSMSFKDISSKVLYEQEARKLGQ